MSDTNNPSIKGTVLPWFDEQDAAKLELTVKNEDDYFQMLNNAVVRKEEEEKFLEKFLNSGVHLQQEIELLELFEQLGQDSEYRLASKIFTEVIDEPEADIAAKLNKLHSIIDGMISDLSEIKQRALDSDSTLSSEEESDKIQSLFDEKLKTLQDLKSSIKNCQDKLQATTDPSEAANIKKKVEDDFDDFKTKAKKGFKDFMRLNSRFFKAIEDHDITPYEQNELPKTISEAKANLTSTDEAKKFLNRLKKTTEKTLENLHKTEEIIQRSDDIDKDRFTEKVYDDINKSIHNPHKKSSFLKRMGSVLNLRRLSQNLSHLSDQDKKVLERGLKKIEITKDKMPTDSDEGTATVNETETYTCALTRRKIDGIENSEKQETLFKITKPKNPLKDSKVKFSLEVNGLKGKQLLTSIACRKMAKEAAQMTLISLKKNNQSVIPEIYGCKNKPGEAIQLFLFAMVYGVKMNFQSLNDIQQYTKSSFQIGRDKTLCTIYNKFAAYKQEDLTQKPEIRLGLVRELNLWAHTQFNRELFDDLKEQTQTQVGIQTRYHSSERPS